MALLWARPPGGCQPKSGWAAPPTPGPSPPPAQGTATKERLLTKLANSKQRRKARLAFLQEED